MTDEQIIRALECCGEMKECKKECPLGDVGGIDKCIHTLMLDALELIKRQQEVIKQLQSDKDSKVIRCLAMDVSKARAEAVREFAERLKAVPIKCGLPLLGLSTKEEIEDYFNDIMMQVGNAVNNLVKEMTEKEGGKG